MLCWWKWINEICGNGYSKLLYDNASNFLNSNSVAKIIEQRRVAKPINFSVCEWSVCVEAEDTNVLEDFLYCYEKRENYIDRCPPQYIFYAFKSSFGCKRLKLANE